MKKMTKVLALLTVMAMLATLFVAVPASASMADDFAGVQPSATVYFTSDDYETIVDPNALPVGAQFIAWYQFNDLPVGAFVADAEGIIAWDSDVVEPAYDDGEGTFVPLSDDAEADPSYAFVASADLEDLVFATNGKTGNKLQAWGRYDEVQYYKGVNNVTADDVYGYGVWETSNANKTKSADTFFEVPASGSLTLFGFCFVKNAAGNVGITIAGNDKTLNGKSVACASNVLPAAATVIFCDDDTTLTGHSQVGYTYIGTGNFVLGTVIDNSPVDSAATEAPTEVPVTEAPTEAPTEVPEAQGEVTGAKEASNSVSAPNAFFYQFTTPVIPGEVTGLTATFQIDGKDAVAGDVTNVNLNGISNVALKIAAIVKNIPTGQETTQVTTNYTLNYSVAGVAKTLVWSRTDSLN